MVPVMDVVLALGAYEDWSPQSRWLQSHEKYRKDTMFVHNHSGLGCFSGTCSCTRPHIQLCGSLSTKAAAYPELLSKEVIGGIAASIPVAEGRWGVWSDIAVDLFFCY